MPLTKTAKAQLQPQQRRVVDRLFAEDEPGVVAYHSLGSGKSLTALSAAEEARRRLPGEDVLFLTPAPLVDNMLKERDKHQLDLPDEHFQVMSYEKALRRLEALKRRRYALIAADEAQKFRNTNTQRFRKLKGLLGQADKRLLLTGSATYNKISDIAPLVNLAANEPVLPEDPKEFERRFVARRTISPPLLDRLFRGARPYQEEGLKNTDELRRALKAYVDFHDSRETVPEAFPEAREQLVRVPMAREQRRTYDYFMRRVPPHIAYKIRRGLPLTKQESKDLNAFASAVRQVSNTPEPFSPGLDESPKLDRALASVRAAVQDNPDFRGIAYSNYLDAGITPYARRLKKAGIPYAAFTGQVPRAEKKRIIEAFNREGGGPRMLLLSSSGGEGLDLKGVRKVQILEPHFNREKINQVIGRASRFHSHTHLPEDQRTVDVENYESVYPKSWWQRTFGGEPEHTIDETLYDNSREKQKLMDQLKLLARGLPTGR